MRVPYLAIGFLLFLATYLTGCGKEAGESIPLSPLSSQEESSSSSWDGRADLRYSDTLLPRDSGRIPGADSTLLIYVGEYPTGTQLRFVLQAKGASRPQVRVVRENGGNAYPMYGDPESSDRDAAVPGNSTADTNAFLLPDSGWWYLSLSAETSPAEWQISFVADTARFFLCNQDTVSLAVTPDTLHLWLPIQAGETSCLARIHSAPGFSLTLDGNGSALARLQVRDSTGSSKDTADNSGLHTRLLPQVPTTWFVDIGTIVPSYQDGNHAFADLRLTSATLGQGEYLAAADSLPKAGDTTRWSRPNNVAALYDVRHDHFVRLGAFHSGDSLMLWYGTSGITGNQKLLEIMDSNGRVLDTLSHILGLSWFGAFPESFRVPVSGPLYLHYMSTGGYFTDTSLTLQFQVLLQQPGSLDSFSVSPSTVTLPVGDTLWLDSLASSASPQGASVTTVWTLSREERDIASDGTPSSMVIEEIQAGWITGNAPGTAHLVATSVADPLRADTITITVTAD